VVRQDRLDDEEMDRAFERRARERQNGQVSVNNSVLEQEPVGPATKHTKLPVDLTAVIQGR
jgi:hypothetical protein